MATDPPRQTRLGNSVFVAVRQRLQAQHELHHGCVVPCFALDLVTVFIIL